MRRFHVGLIDGEGKLAALYKAQLAIPKPRPDHVGAAHLFYRASFVLVGDHGRLIPIRPDARDRRRLEGEVKSAGGHRPRVAFGEHKMCKQMIWVSLVPTLLGCSAPELPPVDIELQNKTIAIAARHQGSATKSDVPPFQIEGLRLEGAGVDDATLTEALKGAPYLKRLILYSTKVSDVGLVELAKRATLLERIEVSNAPAMTDVGAKSLMDLKNLQSIHFIDTGATEAAAKLLQATVESVKIRKSEGGSPSH